MKSTRDFALTIAIAICFLGCSNAQFRNGEDLCPDSTVLEGFTTTGGIERYGIYLAIKDERAREVQSQVRDWLRRLKMLS